MSKTKIANDENEQSNLMGKIEAQAQVGAIPRRKTRNSRRRSQPCRKRRRC